MGVNSSKKQKAITVKSVSNTNVVIQDHDPFNEFKTSAPYDTGSRDLNTSRDPAVAQISTDNTGSAAQKDHFMGNKTPKHSPGVFYAPDKENSHPVVEPKKFTISPGSNDPLKYDRTNANSLLNKASQQNSATFNLSQTYYQTKSSTRTKPPNPTLRSDRVSHEHYSGVYNRHGNLPSGNQAVSEPNVMSLLKKDKFSLLGSHLQQEESKIFQKHASISMSTNDIHGCGGSPSVNKTTTLFDPNRFRVANEGAKRSDLFTKHQSTSSLRSSADSQIPGFKSGADNQVSGFSGFRAGNKAGNGALRSATIGPLDDKDEQLISSIEKEFEFPF